MKTTSLVLSALCCFLLICSCGGRRGSSSSNDGDSYSQTTETRSPEEDISWIYGAWRYITDEGMRNVITFNSDKSVSYRLYDFTGQIQTAYNSGLVASQDFNSFSVSRIEGEDVVFIGNKGGKVVITLYVDKSGQRLLTWDKKEPLERVKMEPLRGKEPYPDIIKDEEITRVFLQNTTFASSEDGKAMGILLFSDDGIYHILTKNVRGGDGLKHKIADSYSIKTCESTHALYYIYADCLSGEQIVFELKGRIGDFFIGFGMNSSEDALARYHIRPYVYHENNTILEELKVEEIMEKGKNRAEDRAKEVFEMIFKRKDSDISTNMDKASRVFSQFFKAIYTQAPTNVIEQVQPYYSLVSTLCPGMLYATLYEFKNVGHLQYAAAFEIFADEENNDSLCLVQIIMTMENNDWFLDNILLRSSLHDPWMDIKQHILSTVDIDYFDENEIELME